MRITTQLLRSRAQGPLHSITFLDLSNLNIDRIEKLGNCSKLRTLNLSGNNIDYVSNLECCHQLWKVDLGNNRIKSLEGLSRFVALGSIILCNNDITWAELAKLRNMHILDLSLHGNTQLEKDPYYRIHVIDCLPNVWMLDGRIITSAERLQVEHFFQESALTDRPVRHKLGKEHFRPSSLKNIEVSGVFGEKTTHLMRRFPTNGILNADVDQRRLQYLAFHIEEELRQEVKYIRKDQRMTRNKKNFLEDLIEARRTDRERCNMLLLLLVASLEFAMPTFLMKSTLENTKLMFLQNVNTMDLFLLPRRCRCSIVSLLLSAVKMDKDMGEEGGLYDKLYLCLYYSVSELTKLAQGTESHNIKAGLTRQNAMYCDSRTLISAEVVQLLCIVPKFFEYVTKDVGVMQLVISATGDHLIGDKIKYLMDNKPNEGVEIAKVYEDVADLILSSIQENALNIVNKAKTSTNNDYILKTHKALPRRPQSSPLVSSEYHAVGRHRPDNLPARVSSSKPVRSAFTQPPKLGHKILLGPQNIARIISIPEADIALVQMDIVPADTGAMVSSSKNPEEHYTYVDMTLVYWDHFSGFWRPKGTVGDRITIQSIEEVDRQKKAKKLASKVATGVDSVPAPPSSPRAITSNLMLSPRNLLEEVNIMTDAQGLGTGMSRAVSAQLKERLNLKLDVATPSLPITGHRVQLLTDRPRPYTELASRAASQNSNDEFTPRPRSGKQLTFNIDSPGDADGEEAVEESEVPLVSRRSSLESMEEPELRNITLDSRPSTAVSRRSGTTRTDLATQGTPDHPIEIPQVTQDPDGQSTEKAGSDKSASQSKSQTSVEKVVSGGEESGAVGVTQEPKPTTSETSTPRGRVIASQQNIVSVESCKLVVARDSGSGYVSPYQAQRTEAWKTTRTSTPGSTVGGSTTAMHSNDEDPPPQRPPSPSIKAGNSKVKVQRGNSWLGGGRDLYWEQQRTRPKTGHTPGWKVGMPSRPKSAAAVRAHRRSKTPTIVTPSSLAYDLTYGRSGPTTVTELPFNMDYIPPAAPQGVRRLGTTPTPYSSRPITPSNDSELEFRWAY